MSFLIVKTKFSTETYIPDLNQQLSCCQDGADSCATGVPRLAARRIRGTRVPLTDGRRRAHTDAAPRRAPAASRRATAAPYGSAGITPCFVHVHISCKPERNVAHFMVTCSV